MTDSLTKDLYEFIDSESTNFIKELETLCMFQSVSSNEKDLNITAEWLMRKLESLGAETKILSGTNEVPIILGEIPGRSKKTLLIYNYYDVVSEGDIDNWISLPFQPKIRKGRIYARGVDSNKGNLLSRIHAVETFIKGMRKRPPITIKFLFEGEEEIGSPNLPNIFRKYSKLLKADYCLWAGETNDEKDRPTISLGTKGLIYLELKAIAKRIEIHSSLADTVENPAIQLIKVVESIVGSRGDCKMKKFYDTVKLPSEEEMQLLKDYLLNNGPDNKMLLFDYLNNFKPTSTICGLKAGYTGQGMKTVLPNEAIAKIDIRLVPDQDAEVIIRKIHQHLEGLGYNNIECKVLATMNPTRTPLSSLLAKAAIKAAVESYNKEPKIVPISRVSGHAGLVHKYLGAFTMAIGVGDISSNPHGPNESISIQNYMDGVKFVVSIFNEVENTI